MIKLFKHDQLLKPDQFVSTAVRFSSGLEDYSLFHLLKTGENDDDENCGNNDDQMHFEIVNQIVDQRFLAFAKQ